METYSEVFKRKEMKYLLDSDQRALIEAAIVQHMVPGEFGPSQVRSLYFDTPEFALIERSLDKPLYKEKLRLRSYGQPSPFSLTFIELKKKFKGIVYKRRVPLSYRAAQAFFSGMPYEEACRAFPLVDAEEHAQSLSPRSLQIAREIAFMMARHEKLAPSLLIACERIAYAMPEQDDELRITFDAKLECAYDAQSIAALDGAVPIVDPAISIMEIKNAGPLPWWLIHALNEAKAYPRSFSKYGNAYLNLRKDDRSA